jgi:hypothetical protein
MSAEKMTAERMTIAPGAFFIGPLLQPAMANQRIMQAVPEREFKVA